MRWPSISLAEEFPAGAPRWVPWLAAMTLIAVVFWFASQVILLLFAAVLFAVFLRALTAWTARHLRLSEGWSLATVILLLAAGCIGVAWLLAPQIARQVDQFVDVFPQTYERFTAVLRRYDWGAWLLNRTSQGVAENSGVLSSGVGLVGGAFSLTIETIVNFALIVIIGLYLAAEARMYRRGFLALVPPERRARAEEVIDAGGEALRGWLLGKILSMTLLGVLSFIGLVLLDVRLALTMAVLTALLAFIPNLGAILSVIPPVLLALADDPWKALYVLILYIVLQNVEGMFLTPMIQRRTASLPPALLIITQLFMAAFFGSFGLLLAAPLGALGIVLVKMLYLEDQLGEQAEAPVSGGRTASEIQAAQMTRESEPRA